VKRVLAALAGLAFTATVGAHPAAAQTPNGAALFATHCAACHDPATERAPNRATLASMAPAQIVEALTTGLMVPMADGLSPADKQALAGFLTSPQVAGRGGRAAAPPPPPTADVMCASNPPITPGPSDWSSWGHDAANTRFQTHPGLKAADVPKLKVKWAFSVRGGSYGEPTVVGDWLFLTTRGGGFYALDAKTGCVHWKAEGSTSRNTPMIVRSDASPSGWATYIGVANRVVRAFDAQTGKPLWDSPSLESHPSSSIGGSIIVSGNHIFVPTSSGEEVAAEQPQYSCCTFRGSLTSIDARTGKVEWQTSMIPEPLHPTHKNSNGVMMQGPAGSAIWSSPTVDEKRGVVYVATGDSYTDLDAPAADAIVALDIKTGQVRWISQVTKGDNYLTSCNWIRKHPANCPDPAGGDFDFGASPLLHTLPNGKQIILAGQKSGVAYGIDPDGGKIVWKQKVGTGSNLGGIEWGIAADGDRVYAPNSDIIILMDEYQRPRGEQVLDKKPEPSRSGLTAMDPATGKVIWHVDAPKADCHYAGDRSRDRVPGGPGGVCLRAESAAASVMPGVVFSGTMDGWMRGYEARTGKIIWAFSTTAQTYNTTNGIKDQPGGSIDSVGPTIANGTVYVMSGYGGSSNTGSNPLNVLLAFTPNGK
jgi:polyvinyl alcohol dehydrogenase (cytochrome)